MALFNMRDSWNVWRRKVDAALGGEVEPVKSEDVTYDNTDSGLTATNVQSAIDEVASSLSGLTGEDVGYDNTDSRLTATNVQSAIDEVNAKPCQLDTVSATPEASVTAATGVFTPVASIELQKGTYYISGHVRFASNNSGIRTINIGSSGWAGYAEVVAPTPNELTTVNTWLMISVEATTTYYLNVYQNSGSDLVVNALRLDAIKIK